MARKKGRPGTGRDEGTVKADRAIIQKLNLVARHRGLAVGELVTELLRGPADRAYLQMIRELEKKGKGGP